MYGPSTQPALVSCESRPCLHARCRMVVGSSYPRPLRTQFIVSEVLSLLIRSKDPRRKHIEDRGGSGSTERGLPTSRSGPSVCSPMYMGEVRVKGGETGLDERRRDSARRPGGKRGRQERSESWVQGGTRSTRPTVVEFDAGVRRCPCGKYLIDSSRVGVTLLIFIVLCVFHGGTCPSL